MTEEDESFPAVKAFLEALASGLCPTCGVKVEEERQVGRCVYGVPCGHRLFQGKARITPPATTTFVQEPLL
jgi:hypothetical protein